jgi:hypothetical protein
MTDRNYKKVEVGQKAGVSLYGHILMVEIYEIENEKVFFRTINPKGGEPRGGDFNRIETERYLTVHS